MELVQRSRLFCTSFKKIYIHHMEERAKMEQNITLKGNHWDLCSYKISYPSSNGSLVTPIKPKNCKHRCCMVIM
jgi:hypothetical protein